jgi:hypothetical protein
MCTSQYFGAKRGKSANANRHCYIPKRPVIISFTEEYEIGVGRVEHRILDIIWFISTIIPEKIREKYVNLVVSGVNVEMP